jgi:hypothetical protein
VREAAPGWGVCQRGRALARGLGLAARSKRSFEWLNFGETWLDHGENLALSSDQSQRLSVVPTIGYSGFFSRYFVLFRGSFT